MKKLQLILTTLIGLVLIGCSSEDGLEAVVTPQEPAIEEVQMPILFSSVKNNTTRGESTGADAAALLNNKFVVFGYKGANTVGYNSANTVFDNYLVEYEYNTAYTTQSNIRDWEYVGKTPIKHASNNGITSQRIKYWDYDYNQYDFIAWSTGKKTAIYEEPVGGVPSGSVWVSAIAPEIASSPATGLSKAYTFTGSAQDLAECYISDMVTVKKANYATYNQENPVTLRFRQLGTKVRIAIYETVPGYSVKDVKFYSAANVALLDETDATNGVANATANATAKLFTVNTNDIHTNGTYRVFFPTVDSESNTDNNQAHVSIVGGDAITVVDWGALNYTSKEDGEKTGGNVYLGRSSNAASFAGDASKNYYVYYLPNESGTNLNLRVNYTLESTDGSGEVINVKGATAQVPSIYTQWKAGYAYIFKISDKTNGHTGPYDPTDPTGTTSSSTPAGLYPITFDAVVENTEDNDVTQETVTMVSTPSITTYQQKSTVVNADEYTVNGKDIFVTVSENDDLVDLSSSGTLYTIPAGKTEAEVIDALQVREEETTTTIKGRSGLLLTAIPVTTDASALSGHYMLTNSVEYGPDGNAISVGTNKALRYTPTASTTYAFVYTKTGSSSSYDTYVPIAKSEGDDVTGLYRYKYNPQSGDAVSFRTYYSQSSGVYSLVTSVYLGQSVSNLYSRTGEGTSESPYAYNHPSGYARTGTCLLLLLVLLILTNTPNILGKLLLNIEINRYSMYRY